MDVLNAATKAATDQRNISHALSRLSPNLWTQNEGCEGYQLGGSHSPDLEGAARTEEAHHFAMRSAKALTAVAVYVVAVYVVAVYVVAVYVVAVYVVAQPGVVQMATREFESIKHDERQMYTCLAGGNLACNLPRADRYHEWPCGP